MPRFRPTPGMLIVPEFTVDRGSFTLDPSNRSTLTKPSVFVRRDGCDDEAYIVASQTMNINAFQDCINGQAASITVKVTMPRNVQPGPVQTYVNIVGLNLQNAIAQFGN